MGFSLGSAFSGVGSMLNGITGVTSSANQAFKQNLALANLSNAYSKEFAQNAHQWEMNDLQKAGLNPALTTGASSAGAVAGAGGNGNSGSVGTSAMSPIDIVSALNQTSATKHTNSLQDNQGKFAYAQAVATIEMLPINKQEKQALIRKLDAETGKARAETGLAKEQAHTEGTKRWTLRSEARFNDRRASGKTTSVHQDFGAFGVRAGSGYTKTR